MLNFEEINAHLAEEGLEVMNICTLTRQINKGKTKLPLILSGLLRNKSCEGNLTDNVLIKVTNETLKTNS